MTSGGRNVAREADLQQADIFQSLLAEHRAELCNHLDRHAAKLAYYESNHDSARAQHKRRRIKEIGADIRDIDRMMHALKTHLSSGRQSQDDLVVKAPQRLSAK